MARAVATCVHCGFCLPACPTYRVLGEEMDSPRGRIVLMKQVLEGTLALSDALPHIDRCLGCLGCVTACPSGVQYGDLIVPFRARPRDRRTLRRWPPATSTALDTLESPALFSASARVGRVATRVERFLPPRLRPMIDLLTGSPAAGCHAPARVHGTSGRGVRVSRC